MEEAQRCGLIEATCGYLTIGGFKMLRSLVTGVSGLQNHLVRMDVIGNNIANVNRCCLILPTYMIKIDIIII